MHIMYVDESGVEDLKSGTSHFVLLGLSVPAERWKALDQAIQQVKAQYGLGEAEIHTAWMHRRYSEQESVPDFATLSPTARRSSAEIAVRKRAGAIGVLGSPAKVKAYRRESRAIAPYLHLTREERLQCLDDLARRIASWHDVRLFADAVSKPDFPNSAACSPYEQAFEQILTRFEACLSNIGSTGIVVHDNNSTAALRLTRLARKFHADGTLYRQIPHIVETPLFVDSTPLHRGTPLPLSHLRGPRTWAKSKA